MFFQKSDKIALKKPTQKLTLIDVGGNGDCGFRSVAAGIVDGCSNMDSRVLDKIFQHFYTYFPQNKPLKETRLLTSVERMDFLYNEYKQNISGLLINLAFVLSQMAVNELVANPYQYSGAFADVNEDTSVESMRKPNTWIDESAIAALANALHIEIKVYVVESNKDLPLLLSYNSEATSSVSMQLMNHHYKPNVANESLFRPTIKAPAQSPQVVDHQDPTMPEILAKIEVEKKKDEAVFNEMHDTLSVLLSDGAITKQDLLDCYIKGRASSDYLQGRVKHVGLEHGSQHFFADALNQRERGLVSTTTNFDEQITQELVHAIARAYCIGDISCDTLTDDLLGKRANVAFPAA